MTRKEAIRQATQESVLVALGFTRDEAESLRRISMTLQRWFELECGTGSGQTTISIERDGDNGDGKPFKRVQYPTTHGYIDHCHPVADREAGARKRLAAILKARNERECDHSDIAYGVQCRIHDLSTYIQTDPRGAALYIIRPGDVPEGQDVSSYYTRGVCVY